MDPAKRFGFAYVPLSKLEKARAPWMEGVLTVPGLRIEIPRQWSAVANLRGSDGFPLDILNASGVLAGRLERLPANSPGLSSDSLAEWKPVKRPSKKSAEAIYVREGGSRLFVTDHGDGLVFAPLDIGAGQEWRRMIETATQLRQGPKSSTDPAPK